MSNYSDNAVDWTFTEIFYPEFTNSTTPFGINDSEIIFDGHGSRVVIDFANKTYEATALLHETKNHKLGISEDIEEIVGACGGLYSINTLTVTEVTGPVDGITYTDHEIDLPPGDHYYFCPIINVIGMGVGLLFISTQFNDTEPVLSLPYLYDRRQASFGNHLFKFDKFYGRCYVNGRVLYGLRVCYYNPLTQRFSKTKSARG